MGINVSNIKNGNDAHNYFLSTTIRSVVIDFHNMTNSNFTLKNHLIISGEQLLQNLPNIIKKNTVNYICHGSNSILDGVQGWVLYTSDDGSDLTLTWKSAYTGGAASVLVKTDKYSFTKTGAFKDSSESNFHISLVLENKIENNSGIDKNGIVKSNSNITSNNKNEKIDTLNNQI